MASHRFRLAAILAATVTVGGAAAVVAAIEPSSRATTAPMTSEPMMSEPMMSEPGEIGRPVEDMPPWQTMEITDVDGEVFTLAEYVGTPVIVETMATWCGNCRRQLGDTNTAAEEVGAAATVVALSVETDLSAEQLAGYAAAHGWDEHIRWAVMEPELLGAIVDEFGNSSINPPATPKFIIDAEGYATELTTGFESPEELIEQLVSAGADLDAAAEMTGDTEPADA